MSRRPRFVIVVLAALAACRAADRVGGAGRLVVQRDGTTIVDSRARASRCAADSTVAVAVTTPEWSAALAARSPWPTDSVRDVPVGQILGSGTAVVAVRPLTDSIGGALVSARGTLRLEPGERLSGSFDVTAPTMMGAPDSVRLTGRFIDIPVSDDLCPIPGGP